MRREPAGRPTGGQFAPTRRPEGDDLDLPGAEESAVARFDAAAVEVCRSELDGALLVQIDTGPLSGRRVRVVLNDGDLFDGDPETHETPGPASRSAPAPQRTGRVGRGQGRPCTSRFAPSTGCSPGVVGVGTAVTVVALAAHVVEVTDHLDVRAARDDGQRAHTRWIGEDRRVAVPCEGRLDRIGEALQEHAERVRVAARILAEAATSDPATRAVLQRIAADEERAAHRALAHTLFDQDRPVRTHPSETSRPAAEVLEQAITRLHQVALTIETAAARAIADAVLAAHPDARYLGLDPADEGDWYWPGAIEDANGLRLGDAAALDIAIVTTHIGSDTPKPHLGVIPGPDGATARLDLRVAAALDLPEGT